MKKRRGSPCKHRYSGTCKSLRQGTNKYCPRRGGVDALLSPSSCRFFLNLQVLNTVEVQLFSVYWIIMLLCSLLSVS